MYRSRYRPALLPWSRKKTVSGTVAFFFSGTLLSWSVLRTLAFEGPPLGAIAAVSALSAAAESAMTGAYDNLVVSVVATVAGSLLF